MNMKNNTLLRFAVAAVAVTGLSFAGAAFADDHGKKADSNTFQRRSSENQRVRCAEDGSRTRMLHYLACLPIELRSEAPARTVTGERK